jgi:hypothetical protein
MRVTATQTQTGRKQQDRSVRRAEKRGSQARMMRIRSLIRTVPAASAAMCASMTAKCLIYAPDQATFTPNGILLGECRTVYSNFAGSGGTHWVDVGWLYAWKLKMGNLQ